MLLWHRYRLPGNKEMKTFSTLSSGKVKQSNNSQFMTRHIQTLFLYIILQAHSYSMGYIDVVSCLVSVVRIVHTL